MFDHAGAMAATERDFGAIIGRLDSLAESDWGTPVRCDGWQVTDLAVHVAGASRGQSQALRRAATGNLSGLAQLDPPAEREPRALLAALKDGQERLLSALRDLPPGVAGGGAVPLPFGLLPAAVALQIVALEYGFHRNDLDWAMGEEVPLGDDMAGTLVAILPGLLPMLAGGIPVSEAGAVPDGAVAFQLTAPGAALRVAHDGGSGGWSFVPGVDGGPVTCEISGSDSALALFAMGRIGAAHPGLTVSDPGAAASFKRYFPGP